jgi:hypothetical protein
MSRRRLPWLVPVFGALVACLLVASPGLAATSGTWTPTDPMELGRSFFTANVLRDGRVLVAGGFDGSSGNIEFKSAELYDPSTASWTPAANMNDVRAAAVSARLPSGRVLMLGGENLVSPALDSGEIYDPRTNTWTSTAPMISPRAEDFVAMVSRGTHHPHVLVAGGFGPNGPITDSEVYDVSTNTWHSVGPMNEGRGEFDWVRLSDGRILAAGGCCTPDGQAISSAEIYDPVTKTWTLTGSLNSPRFDCPW